jgi:hypothetical protein
MKSIFPLLLMLAVQHAAYAGDVYKCKDANGTTVYSQAPCGKDAQVVNVDTSRSDIEAVKDRFTGVTRYRTRSAPVLGSTSVQTVVSVSNGAFAAQLLLVYGTSSSEGWKYLKCHYLNWMLDGTPIEVPSATHDGQVGNTVLVEQLNQRLDRAQLRRFASARSVEYKICNDEYSMSADELSGLRQLVHQTDRDFPEAH